MVASGAVVIPSVLGELCTIQEHCVNSMLLPVREPRPTSCAEPRPMHFWTPSARYFPPIKIFSSLMQITTDYRTPLQLAVLGARNLLFLLFHICRTVRMALQSTQSVVKAIQTAVGPFPAAMLPIQATRFPEDSGLRQICQTGQPNHSQLARIHQSETSSFTRPCSLCLSEQLQLSSPESCSERPYGGMPELLRLMEYIQD